jgi:hypothetical protein
MAFDTLVDKAKLESALTATANAIRTKLGITGAITFDTNKGFADTVNEMSVAPEQQNPSGIIPADIKAAAMDIVRKVNEVRKDDSVVFMAMSDSHHTGEQSDTGWQTLTNLGNLHAGMAAKVLSYALDLDFVCHLGDITFGHGTTTSAQLHQQIGEMNGWLDEAWDGIPRFQTVGNHDTGLYGYQNSGFPMETNDYLFTAFGKYCDGAVYGSETFGYCYRDFNDKKLRVICLNTSEGDSLNANYECSPTQLLWFAQTLKSVGAKSGWNVIVLGHYPLDFVGMHDVTAVVKAYLDGANITLNGATVNFSGSNQAKFIANFHGHTHCFKVARLNTLNTSTKTATEYDAWRVGIPNSGFYRNNHQEGANAYGIYFGEETTYDKVNDGVHDTAFVINVITPSEEVIHSFCYGAGYDRSIGYAGTVWYKVTSELSNCTLISSSTSIEEGKPFTATIAPDEHCSISSIVITMGGVDITASCYSDGQINISSVTGDIVIAAKAIIALACTNQIPISTDIDGNIYNGTGYKKGVYLSSSNGNETSRSASYTTGFIPCEGNAKSTIRLKNVGFSTTSSTTGYERVAIYDSNKQFLTMFNSASTAVAYNPVVDSDGTWSSFKIRANTNNVDTSGDLFIRISASYLGDDSIITVNEEIKYADEANTCVIVNSLINATTNNNASTIERGSAYNATITANNGYKIESVIVTMDGIDITSTAYSNGVITINSVTGNIAISAYASLEAVSYINVLPISTDTDGTIYNSKGWKENTYISGGNAATKNGTFASGFIPCTGKDKIYFKNVTIRNGQDGHRIWFYDSNKTSIGGTKTNNTAFNGFTWDANDVLSVFTVPAANPTGIAFIRFCCEYIGDDSIVTKNEPIE